MVHSFIGGSKSLLLAAMFCVLSFLANGVHAEDVPYTVQSWSKECGHHRVRIYVGQPCDAVWAHIPWRRHDSEPEKKAVIITDAATGKRVQNVVSVDISREYGDLVFQPVTGLGFYEVYYMP